MSEPHIEYLPLASLVAWPGNPKKHATRTIVESIQRFGFVQPIIIDEKTRRLIAGHGRLEALAQIKAEGKSAPARIAVSDNDWLVPVLRGIDFQNEKEAEAYLVTENQTTILGGWDEEMLQAMLKDHVGNLDGVGFTVSEIEALRMPLPSGVEEPPRISNEVLHANWIQPGSVEDWLQSIALGRTLNVCCPIRHEKPILPTTLLDIRQNSIAPCQHLYDEVSCEVPHLGVCGFSIPSPYHESCYHHYPRLPDH